MPEAPFRPPLNGRNQLAEKTKENNHFISRFQLKRFLCDPPAGKPGKNFVWVYDKESDPDVVNIRNVAALPNFYGRDDDTLEDYLASLESRAGSVFADVIRSGECAIGHHDTLADLCWTLSFRTQAIRERMRSSITGLMDTLIESFDGDAAKQVIAREIDRRLEEEVEKELSKLNIFQRRLVTSSPAYCQVIETKRRKLQQVISSGTMGKLVSDQAGGLRSILGSSAFIDEQHNRGLTEFLASGGKCPASVRPKVWRTVKTSEYFVLGDSGVFGRSADGRIVPLVGVSGAWSEIYLPMSTTTAIIGHANDQGHVLPPAEIVSGAISTSFRQFYADRYDELMQVRARAQINTSGELLESSAIKGMVEGLWSKKLTDTE